MRRRAFLLGLAGAVAASGRGSVAPMMERMGRVGVLVPGSAQTAAASPRLRTFYATLAELGWIEGRNIAFEPRYAEGQLPRLAELADELARLGPDVIATASTLPAKAAQAATRRIPIVMMDPGDPIATGLVTSLAHPTANLTGISSVAPDLVGKRLETLKQAVPSVTKVAIFYNAAIPPAEVAMQEMEAAAALLTIQITSVPVRDAHGFEAAFATVRREGADGMIVFADPLTFNNQAA